jgi:hypothetical protein
VTLLRAGVLTTVGQLDELADSGGVAWTGDLRCAKPRAGFELAGQLEQRGLIAKSGRMFWTNACPRLIARAERSRLRPPIGLSRHLSRP